MFLQNQIIIWFCPSSQPCRVVYLDIISIIKSTQVDGFIQCGKLSRSRIEIYVSQKLGYGINHFYGSFFVLYFFHYFLVDGPKIIKKLNKNKFIEFFFSDILMLVLTLLEFSASPIYRFCLLFYVFTKKSIRLFTDER